MSESLKSVPLARALRNAAATVNSLANAVDHRCFVTQPRLPQVKRGLLILPRVVQPPRVVD
jgi:hypothetical protein